MAHYSISEETNARAMASATINRYLADSGTTQRFKLPAATHFGGLWEAAVRSGKHHIRRVVGYTTLTFEGMTTFLNRVEAFLNSRQLQA